MSNKKRNTFRFWVILKCCSGGAKETNTRASGRSGGARSGAIVGPASWRHDLYPGNPSNGCYFSWSLISSRIGSTFVQPLLLFWSDWTPFLSIFYSTGHVLLLQSAVFLKNCEQWMNRKYIPEIYTTNANYSKGNN